MDNQTLLEKNGIAQYARDAKANRGVTFIFRLLIALPLIALFAGCISNEPREVRAGGSYSEEIKSPLPRQMLIDPTCSVR